MKKTLALVIVAAMLLAMVPTFAVSAADVDESTLVDGLTQTSYHMAASTSAWGDAYKWLMGKEQDNASMSYDGMKRFDTTLPDLLYWSYSTTEDEVKSTDIAVSGEGFAKDTMKAPNGDNYMLNWSGNMTASRDVTFTVVANKIDNGFVMSIDGERVFEWWGSSHWFDGDGDRLVSDLGTVTLNAGETYGVDAWFLELTGGDALKIGAYEEGSTEFKTFADLGITFDLYTYCYHADVDRWGDSNNETHPYVKVFMENAAGKKGTGNDGVLNGGNGAQCIEDNFNYDETIEGLLAASKQIGGDVITPIISTWTPAVNDESYINIYSGYISVPETGYYLFGCKQVDNGFYMEIDGTVVFELWANGTWQDNDVDSWYPTAIYLEADTLYPMNAAYLELDGGNLLEPVVKYAAAEADVAAAEAKNMNNVLTYKTTVPTYTDMIAPDAAATVVANGTDLVSLVNGETVNATTGQWDDGAIANIFDNDLETKFGSSVAGNFGTTITWQTTEPTEITHYAITTAQESIEYRRIPTGWALSGSNDGVTYEVIDYVTRGMTGLGCDSNQTAMFEVDEPAAYTYYKLVVNTCWWGGDAVSFAELDLYNYEAPRGLEESLDGSYEAGFPMMGMPDMYELTFDNGTLTIKDNNTGRYTGTYTYDGTFENGIKVYDAEGEETDIQISQNMGGMPTFWCSGVMNPLDLIAVTEGGEGEGGEDFDGNLTVGEHSIAVESWGNVIATLTATEAGTYTISAADGETNAYIMYEISFGNSEEIVLPYSVELEAGETLEGVFVIMTADYSEDVIDLVVTFEAAEGGEGEGGGNVETGDMTFALVLISTLSLGITAVVVSKKRQSVR